LRKRIDQTDVEAAVAIDDFEKLARVAPRLQAELRRENADLASSAMIAAPPEINEDTKFPSGRMRVVRQSQFMECRLGQDLPVLAQRLINRNLHRSTCVAARVQIT